MEPFFDGGLFELIILVAAGYVVNFIFLKKYLLIFFSLVALVAPVLLLFVKTGEVFYWLVSMCIFNALFLVVLLWKQRLSNPNQSLFEVKKYVEKFRRTKSGNTTNANAKVGFNG